MSWFFAIFLLVIGVGRAGAQTTRPVDAWEKRVGALGQAIVDRDPAAVIALVGSEAAVQGMDGGRADALKLLARTCRGTLVFSECYESAPVTLATDIAERAGSAAIPEHAKRKLGSRDESHGRRANAIAMRWVSERLGAREGDRLAVLVFWCDGEDGCARGGEFVFVLLKGSEAGIACITYGDPVRDVRFSGGSTVQ